MHQHDLYCWCVCICDFSCVCDCPAKISSLWLAVLLSHWLYANSSTTAKDTHIEVTLWQNILWHCHGRTHKSQLKIWELEHSVRRRLRRTFSTHWDFSTTCRRRRDLLFQFLLQIFRRRVGIFSLFFLCCFYFLLKVHVNFSSVFYRDYRAVVTSSRHWPFCFHNFVFLLNCLFVLYNAHRISLCVIAVTNFCWKFVDFLHFYRRRLRLHVDTS